MNNLGSFGATSLIIVLYFWAFFWKGLALWKSAILKQKNWFIVIFVLTFLINTYGVLEIAYLFYFATKKMKIEELKFWKTK
jgi:hypothetical protein